MKNRLVFALLIAGSLKSMPVFAQRFPISLMNEGGNYDKEIARGWMDTSPEKNKYYEKGTKEELTGDTTVGFIISKEATTAGVGVLLRTIAVDKYRGKRVRMTIYVKTVSVRDTAEGAGMWFLGIWDGAGVLDQKKIIGTTGWKKYSTVVDISPYVFQITYGVFLHGTGRIFFKKIAFDIVDNTVPVTAVEQAH